MSRRPKGKAEDGLLAIEDRASRPADRRGSPRAPGPGQPKSLDRTQDSLTEAEKRELEESSRYSYPVRRGPSKPRVLADWEFESVGLDRPMAAVELVEPAQERRRKKLTEFFDAVWDVHCGAGLYEAWDALGRALAGPEKDLWEKMSRDAVSLPFHARPEVRRSEAGKFMKCRAGEERDPFTLIKNLLTDGRAVYRVYFEKDEPSLAGLGVLPAVAYLNLPLNEE